MKESDPVQPVEVTGVTLEEAIQNGLDQLGVTRNDVIIEIVEEGRKGMFGMGGREAVVLLTPLRRSPSPHSSRPPRSPDPSRPPAMQQPHTQFSAPPDDDGQESDVTTAREVLEELLTHLQVQATINVRRDDPAPGERESPWVMDIHGPDLGILIGKRGETLNALQYITRLLSSRELQRRANIVLDVEGYKARREEILRKLARRMADQALQTGRVVTLEPMPPNERRIIHISLRNDDQVMTESVGEGDRRKVTIIPEHRKYR